MRSREAALKIRERLNKRSSQAKKNIKNEAIQESVNKATLELCRFFLKTAEHTDERVSDLQVLLTNEPLKGKSYSKYFETEKIPSNYFKHVNVNVVAEKDGCKLDIDSDLKEESNKNDLLKDWSSQPSFDFEQSFHTFFNNKIRIYHNGDFKIVKSELVYYREPKFIKFPDTYQFDGSKGNDDEWEFKEDFCELIIDKAVTILAADIEATLSYQAAEKRLTEQ